MKKQNYDFYCQGFRWFDNYDKTKQHYLKISQNPNEQQYYGQNVIVFNNITELNIIIQELTLLRDSINHQMPRHQNIQREFGTDGLNNHNVNNPYWGELIFIEEK